MKQENYTKLDTKTEIKIYIIFAILFCTIIILDYIDFGLPCFFWQCKYDWVKII